jgi:hypothetical protein
MRKSAVFPSFIVQRTRMTNPWFGGSVRAIAFTVFLLYFGEDSAESIFMSFSRLGPLIPQLFLGGRNHMVRVESELFLKLLERRRSAEGLHADDTASCADIAFPAKG